MEGGTRLLVLPFGSDFSELTEYVDIPWKRERIDRDPPEARITVSFKVVSRASGIGSQFGDLASVLGGSTEGEELLRHNVLEVSLPITELSKDPTDLLYVPAGENLYTAVLETPQGRFIGAYPLDTTEYEIRRSTIDIRFNNQSYTHNFDLAEVQSITDVAHTLAINSPALPKEAAQELQEIATVLHQTTDHPDSFSVFQWHTRNIINRFLEAHTEAERNLAETMDLVIVIPVDRLIINGELRTAWLEIDPDTYFTIGVIDTGEHGAMIESSIQNLSKQFNKHSVGALLGMHSMMWGVSTFALEYADTHEGALFVFLHSKSFARKLS